MIEIAEALSAEFPKESISWRAKAMTKQPPYSAMALAYIDSRDVMDRLDETVGAHMWQTKYEDTKDGVRCGIGIQVDEDDREWIWKWDAAQYTDIEGVKGGHSDAFKRAAVHWGIGRYLYALGAPWVPCSTYQGNDGKVRFKEFTDDPWDYQDLAGHSPVAPRNTTESLIEKINKGLAKFPSALSVYEDWKAKTGHSKLGDGTEDELLVLYGLLREAYNKETADVKTGD